MQQATKLYQENLSDLRRFVYHFVLKARFVKISFFLDAGRVYRIVRLIVHSSRTLIPSIAGGGCWRMLHCRGL